MNETIATILRELAVLYDLKGVKYKPRAFERAADAISAAGDDVEDIYQENGLEGLEHIPGVGEGIAERIEEYLKTKHIKEYDRMKKILPVDIAGITAIEGIGPKTLKLLYRKLGIKTLRDLEHAARKGELAKVRGIGEKEQANILRALEYQKESKQRKQPGVIWPYLKNLTDRLEQVHGVKQLEMVGSLRRMQETIGDLDLLAIAANPERALHAFVSLPQVKSVYTHGSYKALVRLKNGMDADLWVLPEESYGAALIAWTGDKAHNIHLRTIAKKKGYMLDDYGLFKGDTMVAGKTEESVYKKLGMDWIPPEIRTDSGEIEAAQKYALPDLIGYMDLKGDLQVQTDWTDGQDSILRMAQAAESVGLQYIAITDHTKALAMTGGLDEKRIKKQWAEIDRVQKQVPNVKILKGSECDIMKDGSLDLDDATLAQLDVVGVSVHSHFDLSEKEQTQRVVTAMENPNADIYFHPTARKINARAPIKLDIKAVIAAAKRTKTVLEVDADPNRLDLKDVYIRQAVDAGVHISVDSDAHNTDQYAYLRWGIGQARRGWATKQDVINTRTWREMLKLLK